MVQLNPQQAEAVKHIGTPLLVLAGAGSGKTSVITAKISYLINECGLSAANIAAVTFTNKAAREMKERVTKQLSGDRSKGLTVATFHNLGLNIVRREAKYLNLKSTFSIFDDQDSQVLVKEILIEGFKNADLNMAKQVLWKISEWKNAMVTPEMALAQMGDAGTVAAATIYEQYQTALRTYNGLDFDDLIWMPVQLFRENPEVLERWQNRLRYLLVDEYQDTNDAQYELVRLLVGVRGAITVVGDDDQSIYAWRGANPENLAQLQQDFPSLKVIKLEQNYRSVGRILHAANTLIANNPHVFDKRLWSEKAKGDLIRISSCANEEDEVERIATDIMHRHLHTRAPFEDFAILYRGNHQARLLELKLQQFKVPYHVNGGTSFFAKAEVKDILSYLKLLNNPEDDNAFLRIINVPRREIGPSTLEKLANYANDRETSLFNACSELGLESALSGRALQRIRQFHQLIEQTQQACAAELTVRPLNELIIDIGYESWLNQNSSSNKVAAGRMSNVLFLVDSLKWLLEKDDINNLSDAVTRLILRDMMEQQEEDDNQVQLLTLHASKGLEFPHVYMMGVEENLLPHRNSIETDTVDEERRLAYVGITRAQQTLVMTLARRRKMFGEIVLCQPSRFLAELPQDDISWEGRVESSEEQKQERGKSALAGLKNLFDG